MGIKDKRTKILLLLFLLKDTSFDFVVFNEKTEKTFDLSLNQKTKGTISALIKEGLIQKNTDVSDEKAETADKKVVAESNYKLTEKGFYKLCLKLPFLRFLKDKWDGKWRIISYEIPEKKRYLRDRLRREMAGWGLGPWHRSFWLTPHPIIDDLRNLVFGKEEEKYIQSFEADYVFGKGDILVEKVWQKSQLDKKYRQLFKKWHEILSKELEKEIKLKKVVYEYVKILKEDPGLPTEIVGKSWIGFEGWKLFKEIRGILLS